MVEERPERYFNLLELGLYSQIDAASLLGKFGGKADATARLLLEHNLVKGLAHITGGGITENLPRMLPEGCAAEIDRRAWDLPPLFRLLQQRGAIATDEMFRAFNMGVGLIICVDAAAAGQTPAGASEARSA